MKQLIAILIFVAAFVAAYATNAYKFSECDFESNYKCEVVHGIGVFIPPTSWVTVWFDVDDK